MILAHRIFSVPITPLVNPSKVELPDETFDEFATMLHGVGGEELTTQWAALPAIQADALNSRKILLVTAERDDIFPPSHYDALLSDLDTLDHTQIPQADHVFSTARMQLVELTVSWLQMAFES